MLGWFYRLMPREERFFDMFEKHAACLTDGSKALRGMLDGGPRVGEFCQKVSDFENQADLVTAEVYEAVRRSFITPFDRSDIRGLVTSMDDAIDQMNKTARTVRLFDVEQFDDHMRQIGDIAIKTANLTAQAMPLLRAMRSNAAQLTKLTGEIVQLEEESDQVTQTGLKALLQGPARSDAMAYIRGSEIYDHLEKVVDCFQDVANQINGLVVEHL